MDTDTQHNNLIKPLTNKLVNEIKEKHLVSLIAEYEPSTFKTQYHVNVDVDRIPSSVLGLLNKKKYTCIYKNDVAHDSEYKRLFDIGTVLMDHDYSTTFIGDDSGYGYLNCSGLTNEYNEIIIKLFITPQKKFFNGMSYKKEFILHILIELNLCDTLSKLISMEEHSIINYFTEPISYDSPMESLLYLLVQNKQTKIIEQILALEHDDVSYYFKDFLDELDDELCVKILTNHIPQTP